MIKSTRILVSLVAGLIVTACVMPQPGSQRQTRSFYNPRVHGVLRNQMQISQARKLAATLGAPQAVNREFGPKRFYYEIHNEYGSSTCFFDYGNRQGPMITSEGRGAGYAIHLSGGCARDWADSSSAMAMADAIATLEEYYTTDHTAEIKAALDAFQPTAADYRAAKVKPAFPEEARMYQVQAEAAFDKQQYDDVIRDYDSALQVAPWWPEGHYNLALVYGKQELLPDAIKEMEKYLALAPNAPDARKAKDKIYVWQGELAPLAHSSPHALSDDEADSNEKSR